MLVLILFLISLLAVPNQDIMVSRRVNRTILIPVTLVNGKSNVTASSALGVQLNAGGTAACANFTWCGTLPDPVLAGNLVVLDVEYNHATSVSLTVKLGTQTLTAGPITTVESSKFLAEFYLPNATGASNTYTVFDSGSVGITIDWVGIDQWAGIATTTPLRTSSSNQSTTNTTFTAGSVTPTSGDLVRMVACAAGTPARTSFTAGTGQSGITWTKLASDIVSGCVIQSGIWSGAGAFNPQLTTSPTSTFLAVVGVYKADSTKGTLPTGMYVRYATEITGSSGSAGGSFNFEIPSGGNTGVIQATCGQFQISSVTDAVNSWKVLTPHTFFNNALTSTAIASNIAANTNGAITLVLVSPTGTGGDCDGYFYDVFGGDPSPIGNRINIEGSAATSANLSFFTGWLPAVSSGREFVAVSQTANTATGVTSPSGALFESTTFSNQSISGPSLPTENNFYGVGTNSSNTTETWTETFADSGTAPGAWTAEGVALLANGATLGLFSPASVSGNTVAGTGASTTMTPGATLTTSVGDLIAVWIVWDGASTTISSCSDDKNTGNYTVAVGPTTMNGSGSTAVVGELLYKANVTVGGATTITCHFSATITSGADFMAAHTVHGLQSGGTLDAHPVIKHPGSTANPMTCTATGTLNAQAAVTGEYIFSGFWVDHAVNQVAQNVTIQQENSVNTYGNASGYIVVLSTASFTPTWISNTTPDLYGCGVMSFF